MPKLSSPARCETLQANFNKDMAMTCETCVTVKDKPMTYTKCKKCGDWRTMTDAEKELSAKPYRFGENGQPTRNYK